MARNKVATTGATAILGITGLCAEPRQSGRTSPGQQVAQVMRRAFIIRIDDRVPQLGLMQGSGFRRGANIKLNKTTWVNCASHAHAKRSLIAFSKQLVG